MKKTFLYLTLATIVTLSSFPSYSALPSAPAAETSNAPTVNKPATSVDEAMADFKNLSKHEKRERFKDVKDAIKKFKAERRAGNAPSTNTLLLVILAFILPPLAVYLLEGEITNHFWISVLLSLLFWVPGIIYALILILG